MMKPTPETRPVVLIGDDDESLCQQLRWALQSAYAVRIAHSSSQILTSCARYNPDAVLLDLSLTRNATDGREGIELIQEILAAHTSIKIIVITGNQERETARLALRAGAYDYLLKPIDSEELKVLLRRACYLLQLEKENSRFADEPDTSGGTERIVGTCPEMRSIFAMVGKVSKTDATVLISGESGTGKELIAQLIHQHSARCHRKFVPINCGAIPENLLESELFGHEKGAFTGAVSLRKGKFEIADGGTIFLDEIGELSASLQVKILRFLQDHVIERVGGNASVELDVRIIAATNRNLAAEIQRGNFREDLYYRLDVINLEMPPLRVRGEDIDLLAHRCLERFSGQYNKAIKGFSPRALKGIRDYHWPGNVRELENKVRKAVILARHSVILPEDLEIGPHVAPRRNSLRASVDRLEREMLLNALRRYNGIVAHAAAELDVNRTTLYDLMKKHQIDHHEVKTGLKKDNGHG